MVREPSGSGLVEIDTLWNVKRIIKAISLGYRGRNRYIVECKVYCFRGRRQDAGVEIDKLWNVKK